MFCKYYSARFSSGVEKLRYNMSGFFYGVQLVNWLHMNRVFGFLFAVTLAYSCSNKESGPTPQPVIPDKIVGPITEMMVTPINITTPDKGYFLISMNNVLYKVQFNAVPQAQSNAVLVFASDTMINNNSRAFANLGKDAVAYNPVGPNSLIIHFNDARRIDGTFNNQSSFGGTFGESLIATWKDPADPAKPNQKAKDDISKFIMRYSDADGSGPGIAPVYLNVTVTKQ